MVTAVPTGPCTGLNEVISCNMVNTVGEAPGGPVDFKTRIWLVVAPVGTVTVMVVALTTVNEVAAVGPNSTEVTPVKLVPVRVTKVP